MLQKHVYSQWLTAISALLVAGSALAAPPKSQGAEAKAIREKMEMMEMMEMMEKMELADHLDAASACAKANNFSCAQNSLNKADALATDAADKNKIASTQSYVGGQRSRYDGEQRQLAAEQQRQINLAAYLSKADDCLNSQNFVCIQSALDSAGSLAANSSERAQVSAIENKAVQVVQSSSHNLYNGNNAGYGGSSASNKYPSDFGRAMGAIDQANYRAQNIALSRETNKAISNGIQQMSSIMKGMETRMIRQESYNRSCCGR